MKVWSIGAIILAFSLSTDCFAEDQKIIITNQANSNTISQNKNSSYTNPEGKEDVYAKWEKVFEDKTMQVYVDVNNVHWVDDNVAIWKMIDLNKKLNDGALSLWVADIHLCGRKLLQRSSVIHFKGQFGSGKQISRDDNERNIERIKQGSMDDAVNEYVCKLKH